jgi:hypothetical protein
MAAIEASSGRFRQSPKISARAFRTRMRRQERAGSL